MKHTALGLTILLPALLLGASGGPGAADDVVHDTVWARPPLPVNATGTTGYDGGGTYMTETPTIKAQTGYMGGMEARGWVKFDLSTIPSGSDIVACSLVIRCQQAVIVPSPVEVRVLTMNTDLLTNISEPLAQQFFAESQTNTVACETLFPTASGWLTARFTAAGLTALEQRLGQGWAALSLRGVTVGSWNAWFNGRSSVNDSSLSPRMIVSYTAGGGPSHDVAVTSLLAPTGSVPYDTTVTPACSVYNYGEFEPFYRVRMKIGGFYDEQVDVTNHGPGERKLVEFPTWYVLQSPGTYAVSCSTRLDGDGDSGNDSLLASVIVFNPNAGKDVGVSQVLEPSGDIVENAVLFPRVELANYGTVAVNCAVRLVIEDGAVPPNVVYDTTETGIAIPVGPPAARAFSRRWTAGPEGPYATRAFTILADDQDHSNDTAVGGGDVLPAPAVDVGVVRINGPVGRLDTSAAVVASATFRNWGEEPADFTVSVTLSGPGGQVHADEAAIVGLPAGDTWCQYFAAWPKPHPPGDYGVRCSTWVAGDGNQSNDTMAGTFRVEARPDWPFGWVEVAQLPPGPSGKPAKRGAWLAIDPATQLIYATKGNRTYEFYSYDPLENAWTQLADVPPGPDRQKPPDKGSDGICDGLGKLYMTKGYNTLQFWVYNIASDSWSLLPDVPEGPGRKKVKGGTDLAYVTVDDVGYVYLMKGYKTEFYRYNTATGAWETLSDLPYGYKEKWDKGSWMTYDGGDYLYAHQAKYYNKATGNHYMYRYDIAGDSFHEVTGMPLLGLHSGRLRAKKSKEGGSGAYHEGRIFALKGGNTQQFFGYEVADDVWTELDTVPNYSPTTGRKRRVKSGADLVSYGYGAFFALKGNKTCEFWRYRVPEVSGPLPTADGRNGRTAGRSGSLPLDMTIVPSLLVSGRVTLRYGLPRAGAATVGVYDVTGRSVLSRSVVAMRNGVLTLDVRGLTAGIYLVRLDSDGYTATRKLVIQD